MAQVKFYLKQGLGKMGLSWGDRPSLKESFCNLLLSISLRSRLCPHYQQGGLGGEGQVGVGRLGKTWSLDGGT